MGSTSYKNYTVSQYGWLDEHRHVIKIPINPKNKRVQWWLIHLYNAYINLYTLKRVAPSRCELKRTALMR